ELAERGRERIDQLERRWSRFVPGSEISRLNIHAGRRLVMSDDTVLLVRRAIEAWRLTGGAFDPSVLGDVVRAGYDRSFEQLRGSAAPGRAAAATAAGVHLGPLTSEQIEIDGCWVRLPTGTGFDPGVIGKGL